MYISRQIDLDFFLNETLLVIQTTVFKWYSFARKFIHLSSLKTGFVTRINRHLNKSYLLLQGANVIIREASKEDALIMHTRIEKSLNSFLHIYRRLVNVNFFENSDTKLITEKCLTTLYHIETTLRHTAYIDKGVDDDDEGLINFSSAVSSKAFTTADA